MSTERLAVVYRLGGPAERARAAAEEICFEQTVETPPELIGRFFTPERAAELAGRIERFEEVSDGAWEAQISFPAEATSFEIPQLLSVAPSGFPPHRPEGRRRQQLLPERADPRRRTAH